MSESKPTWQQPSHGDRLQVVHGDQPYQSAAYSLISLPRGALFANITTATAAPRDTYTSVATGESSRVELNSDLVYCNHSCDPSVVFDMARLQVRVSEHRPLSVGDALTFFYPSSEWRMVQPFRCECDAGDKCLGYITGGSAIGASVLADYWLNDHIRMLLSDQERAGEQPTTKLPESSLSDGAMT